MVLRNRLLGLFSEVGLECLNVRSLNLVDKFAHTSVNSAPSKRESSLNIGRFVDRQQTSTIQANTDSSNFEITSYDFIVSANAKYQMENCFNEHLLCAVDSFVEFSAMMKSLIISSLELVISRLATMMIGKHRRADDALITVARKIVLLPENF
ncbi:hypothetical protein T07_9337 [Trichinella nelsoni]|uniref:Uncharacterized protein n=1 Tax=Trichinella nelsoni TaxID=6336 RepID=A0A0V0SKY1_9BILA|nr:hypothetical protein T07_9337 [Trichinella nelsoni]